MAVKRVKKIPRIVKGNDFDGKISLTRYTTEDGQTVESAFPVTAAQDLRLNLISESQYKTPLDWDYDTSRSDTVIIHVKGDVLTCGYYGLELTGTYHGRSIRSFTDRLFELVHSNEESDYFANESGEYDLDALQILDALTINLGDYVAQQEVKDDLANLYQAILIALNNKLSRIDDDTAHGKITLLQGIQLGSTFIDGLVGKGGMLDEHGRGTLRSLKLWEWLEVPELRLNRTSVNIGLQWQTNGGGIIESVGQEGQQSGEVYLKLEDGEVGAIALDDLCMGIWHDVNGDNASSTSDDRHGNFTIAGFKTVYFRVTDIPDTDPNGRDNSDRHYFRYTLRPGTYIHPYAQMHFAQRGNPSDPTRQAFVYSTPEYTLKLRNVTTWEFQDGNYREIDGNLEGFSIGNKIFHGDGHVIGNAYIYGRIDQFENTAAFMTIDQSLNGTMQPGDVERVVCTIRNGYMEDVTGEYSRWQITRDSGDAASDEAWATDFNREHSRQVANGDLHPFEYDISWADLGVRSAEQTAVMFTVTAIKDDDGIPVQSNFDYGINLDISDYGD